MSPRLQRLFLIILSFLDRDDPETAFIVAALIDGCAANQNNKKE
jgi:hypothetical protein